MNSQPSITGEKSNTFMSGTSKPEIFFASGIDFFSRLIQKLTNFIHNTYFINGVDTLQNIGIALGLLLFVWVLEVSVTGWRKSGIRRVLGNRSASTVNDIIFFLIHVSGAAIILSWIFSLGIPVVIRNALREVVNLNLGTHVDPLLHLMLYLLMVDFCNYWQHRLMHRSPSLWHIHSFHHSATEFNTITVFREHPLDKAINTLATILPAVVLGIPVADYPIFITIYGIVGFIKHSQVPWRLGWFGKYVIQSPVDHWIHHSTQREHHDKNFANVFAFWDHLFGTYYNGNATNDEIGLPGDSYNKKNYISDFLSPQFRFMKALTGM
jgi:sterol desaturase/sphingolipid hydroxylase (fatty acid hydroxylase superfamily)